MVTLGLTNQVRNNGNNNNSNNNQLKKCTLNNILSTIQRIIARYQEYRLFHHF